MLIIMLVCVATLFNDTRFVCFHPQKLAKHQLLLSLCPLIVLVFFFFFFFLPQPQLHQFNNLSFKTLKKVRTR